MACYNGIIDCDSLCRYCKLSTRAKLRMLW